MEAMALGRLLSSLLSSDPPVACKHAWDPYANERDCTCAFVRCRRCAVVKKLSRCDFHESATQDKRPAGEYFESMGLFGDGIPQNTTYAKELTAALEEMRAPGFAPGTSVLEIGSGIGRLVPWFLKGGMSYMALEPDAWAARYIRDAYDVAVTTDIWEAATFGRPSIASSTLPTPMRRSPRWSKWHGTTCSSSSPKAGTSGTPTTSGCSRRTCSGRGDGTWDSGSTARCRSEWPSRRTPSTRSSSA